MGNREMHILLKFNNEKLNVKGKETTTIEEHMKIIKEKRKLVWGQGSEREIRGLGVDKRKIIENQIDKLIPTYVFFACKEKGERKLYVGNYVRSYDKGTLNKNSIQTMYIPSYYAFKVGTEQDINVVFVEINKLIELDSSKIDSIFLHKDPSKNIEDVRNSSSLFYVAIEDDLYKNLNMLFSDEVDELKIKAAIELMEEEKFQQDVENIDVGNEVNIKDKPKKKPGKNKKNSRESYNRDATTSKNSIVYANYCCEFNESHKNFTSHVTKQNYVEAHHLIPMKHQDDFDVSIDVEANIVSLCVACHKKLHHAIFEEKKKILRDLFEDRKNRLENCGINISCKKLYGYYK